MVSSALFVVAALLSMPQAAFAHGRVSKPVVKFLGPYPDSPVDLIDGYKALPPLSGQSYSGEPEANTEAFTAAFKSSNYKTLRDFVLKKQAEDVRACGASTVDGATPQKLPEKVEFSFRDEEGFVFDHHGPCEVWCGNETRVFHNDNCAKTFRDAPAKLPYDRAKCDASGATVLTFYWLALHLPEWQMYINCAAIATTGAATSESPDWANDSDNVTKTPSHATVKPKETPRPVAPRGTSTPQPSCRAKTK